MNEYQGPLFYLSFSACALEDGKRQLRSLTEEGWR